MHGLVQFFAIESNKKTYV